MQTVLIANRGEIAVRVIAACRDLGLRTVLAVSEADRDTLGAELADQVVCIGPSAPRNSYLDAPRLLAAAKGTGAQALHPGYGFLAENAEFAASCEDEGIRFIGPSSQVIRAMGDKLAARAIARQLGVPVVPGTDAVTTAAEAERAVEITGFPALIKASAGGGGRGIRIVRGSDELAGAFEQARGEARAAFGDDSVFIERYVPRARHVEVQVFGDGHGRAVHFGDRDCTIQRRYQKVIEEAPAVFIPADIRQKMQESAVLFAEHLRYASAGTVEFLYDCERGEYYFLEMNTRIQVEHPVTEEVCGADLVRMQLQLALGESLVLDQAAVELQGHAIECRIIAEDPEAGFRPSPGRITTWRPALGRNVRMDTHCFSGYNVPPYYDSLLGKLVVYGDNREQAIARMVSALNGLKLEGVKTNIDFLREVLVASDFVDGAVDTQWLENTFLPQYHTTVAV